MRHLFRHFESNLPTNCPHGRTSGFVDDLIPFNEPKRIKFSIHHLLLVEIWQKYGYFCINEFNSTNEFQNIGRFEFLDVIFQTGGPGDARSQGVPQSRGSIALSLLPA